MSRQRDVLVVLCSAELSRSHARIELRGDSWFVVELDSRNGLRHDGERVAEVALKLVGRVMTRDGVAQIEQGALDLAFVSLPLDPSPLVSSQVVCQRASARRTSLLE